MLCLPVVTSLSARERVAHPCAQECPGKGEVSPYAVPCPLPQLLLWETNVFCSSDGRINFTCVIAEFTAGVV